MFNINLQRQVAFVIAETTNRTMGGKGVLDFVRASFNTGEKEDEKIKWTKERIDKMVAAYNQKLLERGYKLRKN